jgi:hypothetical protein
MLRRIVPLALLLAAACAESERPPAASLRTLPKEVCSDRSDGAYCVDSQATVCEGGRTLRASDCAAQAPDGVCVEGACMACRPGQVRCEDDALLRCRADGTALEIVAQCALPEVCSASGCRDLCADAAAERSYLGCTYFPAMPINSELEPSFAPAVVVGNPQLVTAHITLSRAGRRLSSMEVLPGTAAALSLPREPRLQTRGISTLLRDSAFMLVSDVPVVVQQWNPLEFKGECLDDKGAVRTCGSVTNDASLLVPAEALWRVDQPLHFLVATRPTFALRDEHEAVDGRSGFVLIVGASPQRAHVEVRAQSHTEASADAAAESLRSLAPGEVLRVELGQGDVLQLLSAASAPCAEPPTAIQNGLRACIPVEGYDLTGTEISADAPVTVIAGHDCTNVPFDRPACDHLEESLTPTDTWEAQSVVPRPRGSANVPFLVQVISADDGNEVVFEPGDITPITLARGEAHTFESSRSVSVRGTGRLSVMQYLEGQGEGTERGDPSMTYVVPPAQWRSDYTFLTPSTYAQTYATFVGRAGTVLELDGQTLLPLVPAEGLATGVRTQSITAHGAHRVTSVDGSPFAVQLSGTADYTSYMCPGGLSLRILPDPG